MKQCERFFRFASLTPIQLLPVLFAAVWLLVGGNALADPIDPTPVDVDYDSPSDSTGDPRSWALASGERTLQQLLDSLGYDIDVAHDETGIETFCSPDGFNRATMILEVAGSAASARSGYYRAGYPGTRVQLFGASDGPGDSVSFTINPLYASIGFYMEPNLTTPTKRWYSETSLNSDAFDHIWVFPTGDPTIFVIAFEDVENGGDRDYQDLVIKVIFDYAPPTLSGCPSDLTISCTSAIPAPATVTATADCDPNPTVSYSQITVPGSCPQTYRLKRTWTATDKWGGTASCVQWIDVVDNVAPVLAGCPSNVTVPCGSIPAPATVTATDNCDPTPTVTMTQTTTPGSCAQSYTLTRTWTAVDDCGNSSWCSQVITVQDTQAPSITCPPTATVQCLADVPVPNPALVTASDNCDPAPVITFVGDVSNGLSCPQTITRTYRATDACGNIATCTQLIVIDDTIAPVVTCPAPVTVQCLANVPAPNPSLCAVSDNCDPTPTVTFVSDVQAGSGCALTITRTYKAVDDCGNEATCTQTITVQDTTPPVVTCPANTSVLCGASIDPSATGYATATDNCTPSGSIVITYADVVGGGTITRTWTAADACGNQSSCVQTITTAPDTTPPAVVNCPGDLTVDCFANVPSPAPLLVVANDNCDPNPVTSYVGDVQSGSACPYTITRTYRVTDASGNYTDCIQIITIDDNTPPVLAGCPSNVTVNCEAIPAPATVTATDNCGGLFYYAGTGHWYEVVKGPARLVHWVSWTQARDAAAARGGYLACIQDAGENAFITSIIPADYASKAIGGYELTPGDWRWVSGEPFTYTNWAPGEPKPEYAGHDFLYLGQNNPGMFDDGTDCCADAYIIEYPTYPSGIAYELPVVLVQSETPGICAQEKTITRTWTATDFCGNTASCTQMITVVDETAPVIVSSPGPVSVQCVANVPAANTSLVTATDNCDPAPVISFVGDVSNGLSCPETITRTYKAEDACGNATLVTQLITVDDTTPPTITCPAPATVECLANVPLPNPSLCTASDNCDPTPTITFVSDVQSGSGCPLTVTRTYKAVDDCGNESFCTQTFTIDDQTPPTITCPGPIAVSCLAGLPAPTPALCTVSDNCDPSPVVTFVGDAQSGSGCPMTITRTYKATDFCGNEAFCTQTIVVDDETPPTVVCPAPITVQCASLVPAPNPALCTVADDCDPSPSVVFISDVSNGQSCPEIITRTYKAVDDCGNEAFCTQTITVDDTTPPTLACPAPQTVECLADVPVPNPLLCTVSDNCDPTPTVTFVNDVQNGSGCPLTITRTYKAVDDCGNESFCTQTITVDDNTPPVITCPAPVTVQCVADVPAPNAALCSATDNCDPTPTVVFLSDNSSGSCPITITRTYQATDDCGNQSTCTQIITVDDTTPPVLAGCPADVEVECDQVPAAASVTATDNCGTATVSLAETITPGVCAQSYIIRRVWTAIDACGNSAQCQQFITVRDTEAPQVTCPGPITVNCLSDAPTPNPSLVVVTDNCDPAPAVTFVSDVQEGTGCPMYVVRTYRAVDACGNAATCSQIITVDDQELPQLVGCPASVTLPCGSTLPPVPTVTATDNCGPATVAFAQVTTPGNCAYNYTVTRTWTATDVCGNQNSCQQVITISDDEPPLMTCPGPVTVECMSAVPQPNPALVVVTDNCDPAPVVTFLSDVVGTQRCPAIITRTYRAVDACGNVATCTQTITVQDVTPPMFTVFPQVQNIFQCQPAQICLPVAATDNCSGPVTLSVESGQGVISAGNWCVTPTGTTVYDVIIRATDTCGNYDAGSFRINYTLNARPTLSNCPGSAQVHWGQTYTYDFNATDADAGDDLTFSLCPGAPAGASINPTTGVLSYTATAQDICDPTLCVIVKDECNAADTCSFNICVDNYPPVISCPEDETICYGYPLATQVTATDPDGGPYRFFYLVSGPTGVVVNSTTGEVTWPNPTPGTHDVCVMVTDSAATCSPCSPSNADTCCFAVKVVSLDLVIEKVHDQIQGQYTDVSIDFLNQGTNWPIAGYDLLIQYDASALNFQLAAEGEFFTDCEWEYFTYRFGPSGNCGGGACPTGVVRIVALAETSGGNLAVHPDCYANDGVANPGPNSTTATEMARMRFLVSNDRTVECQYVPIRFVWYDCADNALSNVKGDTLFISHMVFDYAGEFGPAEVEWREITGLDNEMPTVTGAPSPECDVSFKYEVIRCANFYNGGIDIICADSIDAPGDVNLNGISYEVADAVMLTNYFVNGLSAFSPHIDGSVAASDTNRDGVTLSVADLVLLIRVIVGDCLPYAKEAPVPPVAASYSVEDGVVAVAGDYDFSGAALVVRGDVTPRLLAEGMEMTYRYDGTVTRIVVTSPLDATAMHSFRGAFLEGIHGGILSLELATSQGVPVNARNVPAHFSLNQNYPNPFNPNTTVEFALPVASDYRLTIYNIEGRLVDEFQGRADMPGVFQVEWNAGDLASGVYLYRLDAGTYSQTRKMLLLK